jgi:hypothetical protein
MELLGSPQQAAKRFSIRDNRITCEAQRLQGSLSRRLVTRAACISDYQWDEAQIGGMAGGWLYPNFYRNSDDGD